MIYTYKNIDLNLTKVEVTGVLGLPVSTKSQEYFCQNLAIDLAATLDPSFLVGSKFVEYHVASDGIRGSLKISYYLTGEDLIRDFLSDDKSDISGNIAGMTFGKGRVANYSLDASPNSPIVVSAEIVFFDQLSGSFIPVFKEAPSVDVFNYYNTFIDNLSANVLGPDLNIFSFNYSFSNDISPVFKIESGVGLSVPSEINIGKKQASFTFDTDKVTGVLPFSGQKVDMTIGLKNFTGLLIDTIRITGNISQKSISTSIDQIINNKITISQSNVSNKRPFGAKVDFTGLFP